MTSLKEKLYNEIKQNSPFMVTINRIEQLAKEHPAKMSQAERRMRELCHGEEAKIKPIFHEKGYIGGYIFKSEPKQVKLL